MTKYGSVEFEDLKELQKELLKMQDNLDRVILPIAKELAARLLTKVKRKTPVGQYHNGKTGGSLKKAWQIGEVKQNGDNFEVEIFNTMNYADYVESGHRTRERKDGSRGWVEGKFMLTISVREVQTLAPKLIEKRIANALEMIMLGK